MKVLIFSDLHVHNYQQFNKDFSRLDNTIGVIEYVYKLADKNDINEIWFAGDLFDQFDKVSVVAMHRLLLTFMIVSEKYPNIRFSAINGNHDFATKNTRDTMGESALKILRASIPRFYVIDNGAAILPGMPNPTGSIQVHGIPFYEDMDDFDSALDTVMSEIDSRGGTINKHYLLMHQMIWPDNDIVPDDVNYKDKRFKKFDWVFNGHVHHPLMFDNFINVGSPLHRDASDVGIKKGLWLLDTDSDALPAFWDMTDKNPQFIKKAYGEKVTEEEESQYIVWYHPDGKKKKSKETFDASKFNTSLAPAKIMDNFLVEVEPNLTLPKKELYEIGVKLLTK